MKKKTRLDSKIVIVTCVSLVALVTIVRHFSVKTEIVDGDADTVNRVNKNFNDNFAEMNPSGVSEETERRAQASGLSFSKSLNFSPKITEIEEPRKSL